MLKKIAAPALLVFASGAFGEASSTSSHATFEQCEAVKSKVITDLNVPPSQIIPIINTSIMTVTRICTADGSVLISCSREDEKMVVTRSTTGC
ncbi:hypothetical protein LF844_09885 [Metapseudomonas lalkuanensis]|uniref:hypothetical protein n=1 Tax=Metapseudomonas lalkuanensis TaxID=2604832 RepID=UPI001CF2FACF|nr:hypothetical protein [Pseudomonas lalkuanensis]UCP00099.1 hypothetical protein LF844_09885 [Pseudomonas lalkuanensis]